MPVGEIAHHLFQIIGRRGMNMQCSVASILKILGNPESYPVQLFVGDDVANRILAARSGLESCAGSAMAITITLRAPSSRSVGRCPSGAFSNDPALANLTSSAPRLRAKRFKFLPSPESTLPFIGTALDSDFDLRSECIFSFLSDYLPFILLDKLIALFDDRFVNLRHCMLSQ